ncbi:MAG: Snf7 family protein [Nitrososphaerales archaeon]
MSRFSNKWTDRGSASIGNKIRDSLSPNDPLKNKLEIATKQITAYLAKLDSDLARVRAKDSALFEKVVSSLRNQKPDHASMVANELVEVRKMNRIVTKSSLALHQVALRLTTIRDFGDAVTTLNPSIAVMKDLKSGLTQVVPNTEAELSDLGSLLKEILHDAGNISGVAPSPAHASEEAKKIMDEASDTAERKLRERFPPLPTSLVNTDRLEEIDY